MSERDTNAGQPITVAVIGASGRMGRFAADLVAHASGLALVAEIGRGDELASVLRQSQVNVGLDVTRAGLGFSHGQTMLACGVRPLIGTSGVSLAENETLDREARACGLGGLVVPNFSLGMWLLQSAAIAAAVHFGQAEILEMHHERKRDAPSGTALDTAERIAAARGAGSALPPIHSVRLPGLYAHQLVMYGAPGEVYTLRHDMHGPEAFARGIVCAIRYAARAVGVARGIGCAFEDTPDAD